MSDIERIVAGLTEAQRAAFGRMKVREPHSFMPTYHAVEFYGGDLPASEIEQLCKLGLVTLPIVTGGRGSPTYCGEIHPLGQQVRAHLERQAHD